MFRNRMLLTVLGLFLAFALPGIAQPVTKQLAPGVVLTQETDTNPQVPLVVNCVSVDLTGSQADVKAAIGKDVVYVDDWAKGRENISKLTSRRGALVGINADFFPFTGDPLGICVIDGELVSEPPGNRAAFAIAQDRAVFLDTPGFSATLTAAGGASRAIDGINRSRETGQIVVYTEAFGASTRSQYKAVDLICTSTELPVKANKPIKLTVTEVKHDATDTPIPKGGVVISGGGEAAAFLSANVKAGDAITAQFDIKSPNGRDWSRVAQAVSGGPWLVRDGKPWIDNIAEGFSAGFATTKHPRTALGLTADNKLLLVTVDGRQWISGGIALADLAALMMRLGAVSAINLDGGGSSTLSVRGIVVNSTSEGEERPVADGLLVFARQIECAEVPRLSITGVGAEIASGPGVQLQLMCESSSAPLPADQLANVVWGTTGGVGFVNQNGYFTPIKARKGTVNALYGSQIMSVDVNVLPGPTYKVTAVMTPDKTDPLRAELKVIATDKNANRVPGKEVLLNITGGKSDVESGVTSDKGEFTTNVTWDQAATDRLAVAIVENVSAEARPK